MTTANNKLQRLYTQISEVQQHIDALKDIYQNAPTEHRYVNALTVIGDNLDKEFKQLTVMSLSDNSTQSFSDRVSGSLSKCEA